MIHSVAVVAANLVILSSLNSRSGGILLHWSLGLLSRLSLLYLTWTRSSLQATVALELSVTPNLPETTLGFDAGSVEDLGSPVFYVAATVKIYITAPPLVRNLTGSFIK